VLQARLVQDRADPADAVRQVRDWLADPARATVPDLPAGYTATLAYADLADPMIGSALVHRGI
jgi:hypothetical protein